MREDSSPLLLLTSMLGEGHAAEGDPSHLSETLMLGQEELPPQAVGRGWF